MLRHILLPALAIVSFALPAHAQENSNGIAFAYAAEQGAGICTGSSPEKALNCARAKCAENGAAPEDCARIAWCFPAGWSVGIGVMHKEGIHWSEFSCGWPTREAAIAAGKLKCEHQDKAVFSERVACVVCDPSGREIEVNP